MSVGIRHDDLRRRNRAMVIAAVRRAGQPSRTEIAATTGLSHSTISAISADLIAEGILAETKGGEPAPLKRGRPQVAIGAQPEAAAVIVASCCRSTSCRRRSSTMPGGMVAEETRRLPTLDHAEGRTRRANCVAMLRRLIGGPRRRPAQAAAHRARHPGHHRRRRPHHAVVADHAAQRHPLRRPAGARIRHPDDRRERLQHDRGGACAGAIRSATATISSPSCCRTASAWGWC